MWRNFKYFFHTVMGGTFQANRACSQNKRNKGGLTAKLLLKDNVGLNMLL